VTINNLIIPDTEKLKLKTITRKIYQSIQLTEEETLFWNSFPNSEKSHLLTGDTAQTLDFAVISNLREPSNKKTIIGRNQTCSLNHPLQTLIPQKTLTTFHQFK
jgi:hypothetical protein